jgi:hypothetical protein
MTWTCPTCDRDFPDSSLSVPVNHDAETAEGCRVCWKSPPGTIRFVRPETGEVVDT